MSTRADPSIRSLPRCSRSVQRTKLWVVNVSSDVQRLVDSYVDEVDRAYLILSRPSISLARCTGRLPPRHQRHRRRRSVRTPRHKRRPRRALRCPPAFPPSPRLLYVTWDDLRANPAEISAPHSHEGRSTGTPPSRRTLSSGAPWRRRRSPHGSCHHSAGRVVRPRDLAVVERAEPGRLLAEQARVDATGRAHRGDRQVGVRPAVACPGRAAPSPHDQPA